MKDQEAQFNKPPVYGQWIDVKERLPEVGQKVYIALDQAYETIARFIKQDEFGVMFREWNVDSGEYNKVTHWMPLPPSPGSVDVEEKQDFRTILKNTREGLTLGQRDFAESLGISAKHLNRIENCIQFPSWPLFFEICSKLGLRFNLTWSALSSSDWQDIMTVAAGTPVDDGLGDSSGSEKEELPAVIKFLLGEGTLNGKWYGQTVAGTPFWWRKELRKLFESVKEVSREGEIAELHEKLEEITFYEEEARRQIGIRDQLLEDIFYNRLKPEVIKHKIDQILNLPF